VSPNTAPDGAWEPREDGLDENRKEALKLTKLGFQPVIYANVAGVVAGGEDRQDILRQASAFVTARSTLSLWNGGLMLYPDKQNKFDRYAIQVWLATAMVNGRLGSLRLAGFIPRRACTNCWKSFGGKDAEVLQCPYCHGPLNGQPMSWLNKFICENYYDKGLGIWCSVWWINQANPQSYWGCQLALGFPPTEPQPPGR
jgi:hypothetical protein